VPLTEKPGRLYVGNLSHGLSRQQSLAPIIASLLIAPDRLFGDQEDAERLLDAWWTMVVYHGSLKDVINSHNVINIDLPDYVARYTSETDARDIQSPDGDNRRPTGVGAPQERFRYLADRVAQLTSLSSPEENAATFKRLENRFDDRHGLDVVLATNMISVGLDVSRLALMVVNGQPLTTAEYIQASSRVGRGDVPGLILVNFFRDQARSLSHYESFRSYHESFYRFVEPTSITPFTQQARSRALHSALVIAVRHCCRNLLKNEAAGRFDPQSPEVGKVIELLQRRLKLAATNSAAEVSEHLQGLVNKWHNEALRCRNNRRRLDYQAPRNNQVSDRLLYNHGDRFKGVWPTLQSMRNVENTTLLKIQ
jgi:hypothetical protein